MIHNRLLTRSEKIFSFFKIKIINKFDFYFLLFYFNLCYLNEHEHKLKSLQIMQ